MKNYCLQKPQYILTYDLETGLFHFSTPEGLCSVNNACAGVELKANNELLSLSTTDSGIKRSAEECEFEDEFGAGTRTVILHEGYPNDIKLIYIIKTYQDRDFILLSLDILNMGQPVNLVKMYPFRVIKDKDGSLEFETEKTDLRFFKNGWQSWSPTRAFRLTETDLTASRFPIISRMTANPETTAARESGHFCSEWFCAMKDLVTGESLILGATTMDRLSTQIMCFAPQGQMQELSVTCHLEDKTIPAKGSYASEEIYCRLGLQPEKQLATYARFAGMRMRARNLKNQPWIWCSWYYYFEKFSEAEALLNIAVMKRDMAEFPYEILLVDDGYEKKLGEWRETNERFPNGMKALSEQLKAAGLKLGVWLAPFLVYPTSAVAKQHPDWLLKSKRGGYIWGGVNPRWGLRPVYVLDPTYPEVQYWLQDLIKTMVNDWEVKYIKLDFLYAAALGGAFYDRNATRVEALRKGLEVIREAAGDDVILEGCGCPLGPAIGIVDIMRTAPDIDPKWMPLVSKVVRDEGALSTQHALRNGMTRAFLEGAWWKNYPDCLMLRKDNIDLTNDELLTLASVVAMNGGGVFHSDNLTTLPTEQKKMLKLLWPPLTESAVTVDLFENAYPQMIYFDIEREFDNWKVVTCINWDDEPKNMTVDLEKLGYTTDVEVLAFDFWNRKFLGQFQKRIPLGKVPAHGSRLLSVRQFRKTPQIVSSLLHFSQGAVEIECFEHDEGTGKTEIGLRKVGRHDAELYLYIPPILSLTQVESSSGVIDMKAEEPGIIKMTTEFEDSVTITLTFIH